MIKKQTCNRCIMSTEVDSTIEFNDEGICNHCARYDRLIDSRVVNDTEQSEALEKLVAKVKADGKSKEYDCILGVSGGVDSSYVAYLTKHLGLRPLAIHFDNGWNSELAVKNIEQILKKLDIELFTYVINWKEFKDLQVAFLKGGTPDGEIPSDHAINALLWREAARRGIKYIFSGMNFRTESICVPSWAYGHTDWRYIKDVHKKFGKLKLTTYPSISYSYLMYVNAVKRVRVVSLLNYVDYNKEAAMELLSSELGWVYYGGKHYESTYTRFFQSYVLPKKFNIDKRYGHLSDLINSGQISREDALKEVEVPPYWDVNEEQIEYVVKKLGLSFEEFNQIMNEDPKSFTSYRNSYQLLSTLKAAVNFLRKVNLYPK